MCPGAFQGPTPLPLRREWGSCSLKPDNRRRIGSRDEFEFPEALANQVRATSSPPTSPIAPPDDPYFKWKVLFVSGSGIFMVTLDSGVVNVALPALAREFDAALTITQWVSLGYVLSVTGFLLPAGKLADLRGRATSSSSGLVHLDWRLSCVGSRPVSTG